MIIGLTDTVEISPLAFRSQNLADLVLYVSISLPASANAPDFIPRDHEYNKYLARTWDDEFEDLVNKREQCPPS
ncbi:hypothetical protein VUN82_19400 [Micrococcaceae bacterium Sec5.1]